MNDKAGLASANTFNGQQIISNNNMGTDNGGLVVQARTDQNIYSRPCIYMDCYGRGGCFLYYEHTDGKLHVNINGEDHVISMN